jgi:hypothetical protein
VHYDHTTTIVQHSLNQRPQKVYLRRQRFECSECAARFLRYVYFCGTADE